ncbi:MAG: DUF255 domain-containing protein [Lewinellaceae bacterium]|nr:DUF255 domain-containing protein [Lewinellaceae bacterium]
MTIKAFLTLFLIGSTTIVGIGQNKIKWLTWAQALEKSKVEKRKIFVDIYTDWCGWCKKLDATTFSEDQIAKYLNENYYPVKFNAEMQEPITLRGREYVFVKSGRSGYHELAAQLLQGKLSYPSMVFLDENFGLIQSIPGYQDVNTFEMIITYFGSNSHKSVAWQKYMMDFNRNNYFNIYAGKK